MATHHAYVQESLGGKVEIQKVDTPTPSGGEVLIEVLATPILSYTNAVLSGSLFPLVHPLTLGISAIGRIASTGPDTTSLNAGQLVFCNPVIRARDDPAAALILHGWFGGVSAEARKLMEGPWRNGAWAEKMMVPIENVIVLPEQTLTEKLGYSIPQLCWINEFLVPFGGWLAADLKPGACVIVAPATGHFGACAVQVALALGVGKVVAAGRNANALEKVEQLDKNGRVKAVQLSGDVETDTATLRKEVGVGADAYLDFSPPHAAGATHPNACIGALKAGGYAVLMGGVTSDISINYASLMLRNITVRGNFMYPPTAPAQLVGLVESGLISLSGLKTGSVPFEDLHRGIEEAEKAGGAFELTALALETK